MAENLKIELSDEQTLEIGRIVADNLGAHFQTRVGPGIAPLVYLSWQHGPKRRVEHAVIYRDGTVIFNG